MNKIANDPLLAAARIMLILLIGIVGFATLMMTIGFPALLIFRNSVVAEMAAEGVANGAELIPALAFVTAGATALLGLTIYFLVLLYRIVNSVGEGDPFARVNAERLAYMGWTALIGQIAAVPVGLTVVWIGEKIGERAESVHLVVAENLDIDLSGLLLVLTLFILARVFRTGTEMHQDLEGTV